MPHEGDAAILRRYYPLKYAANVETINRLTRALMVSEAPVWIVPVLKEDIE